MVFGLCSPSIRRSALASLLVVFLIGGLGSTASAFPDLIITVGDTYDNPGQLNSVITVYLDNFKDTISAFELWIQLDRPDILQFQTDTVTVIDTLYWKCDIGSYPTCQHEVATDAAHAQRTEIDTVIATIGDIDTAGALTSGWQMITTRSVSGTPYDIKIIGLADDPSVPGTKMGIRPQQGGVLFRLRGDVFNISDEMLDRTVKIKPNADVVEKLFNFSRPNGTAIGILTIIGPDTNYYRCNAWVPPHPPLNQCLQWVKVSGPPYDLMVITIDTTGILDTSKVWLATGSLTVLGGYTCGNVNGAQPATCDISDLSFQVAYMFLGGPPPSPMEAGNTNCSSDGIVDISDLSQLVDHLFITLTPLCCENP